MFKGQSAIEYLTTYGWMLVALSIVGTAVLQFPTQACNVEASGFSNEGLVVESGAVTSSNEFHLSFRSSSNRQITVSQVEIGGNNSIIQSRNLLLDPGETRSYRVAEIEESVDCAEVEMTVQYDIGPLPDQKQSGTISLPAHLAEVIESILTRGGGEIQRLEVDSTIMSSDVGDQICIGASCTLTKENTEEQVNRSGDEMLGYLQPRELDFNCIGRSCNFETGEAQGYVSDYNNTMDGTLNVTEIYRQGTLCLGRC